MTSIDVGTDVDWEEFMNSFQRIRDYMGEGINGTLLLKAMLAVVHETRGGEDESSLMDTGPREAVISQYNRYLAEVDDDLEAVNDYYRDVLHDYIMDENRTQEEEDDILPILMEVVEDNYSSPEFRSSYSSRTITNRILDKALELYESGRQMVSMLGKNVGGLATQYLR